MCPNLAGLPSVSLCPPLCERLTLRVHLADLRGEVLRVREDGLLRLHPDEVGVGCVRLAARDARLNAAVEAVVALTSARLVPAPVGLKGAQKTQAQRRKQISDELELAFRTLKQHITMPECACHSPPRPATLPARAPRCWRARTPSRGTAARRPSCPRPPAP